MHHHHQHHRRALLHKLSHTSPSVPGPLITYAKDWPQLVTPRKVDEGNLLQGILRAQTRVYDVCVETPLQFAPRLSAMLNNRVYLKREDQQPVFSFKIRGAHNKMASLSEEKLARGIVTCSAGNHAQGVAYSARALNVNNIIVMPKGTPSIKVDAVRSFGGNVVLHGDNYDQAQAEAMRIMVAEGRTLIHPFDDFEVICGQATVGVEISKQLPRSEKLHAAFCCVGGGGLFAGVASYLRRVTPQAQMIGVEACDAAAMTRSVEQGKIVTLDTVGLFADGAAVRTPGAETFSLIRAHADAMVTVTTDEICAAIKAGFNDTRTIMEPAGALGVAGLIRYCRTTGIQGKTLVAVTSGANMDFDRLRFVSERADSSEVIASAVIPERAGSFWELYMSIFPRNITEFCYRMVEPNAKAAHVLVGFQPKHADDLQDVCEAVSKKSGFRLNPVKDNELAKTHVRYMTGGRAFRIHHERSFRFEFPEKPGALKQFLESLFSKRKSGKTNSPFNVTMFHYRSHGSDVGRVFCGFLVENEDAVEFEHFLKELCGPGTGFSCYEETDNPVYKEFLL